MSETGALCGETTFAIQECVSQKAKQQFAAISFNRAKFDFIKKKKKRKCRSRTKSNKMHIAQ